uniref:C2H2-type domain-containing protein n=2 Tax=Sphaeramia orbicularis TaxID=375764 RepID=A0A673BD03_9TELE
MCEACGKSFASKEYLRHHSNIHTGSRPFKCEECGRGFAQRNSLNQHLKVHTGERPYGCKYCEKQFTQLNALQRHQRIHTGEKPYMCGLCTRTFTDKSTLRRHTMIHDSDAPWKTYLVVLKGNVEDKPAKAPAKSKTEKAGAGEKKSTTKKKSAAAASVAGAASAVSVASAAGASDAASAATTSKTQSDSIVVAAEQVTVPSDWTSHGTIALVSHGALGGLTVIHTDMPPGTQIQPIVTTDGTGTSVLSLDGSTIPFSLPVSVAHHIPLSSEASSSAVALPTLSVPVSVGTLASGSQTTAVCTTSVLEAVATQTVLAAESDAKATPETDILPPDIQTVIITDGGFVKDEAPVVKIIKEQKETQEAAGEACE